MAEIAQNTERTKKKLDQISNELRRLAKEQDELIAALEDFRDEKWTWVCEHILEPEKQRLAYGRCEIEPELVVVGAVAQGQFNEVKYLLNKKDMLEKQERECAASIEKYHIQLGKLEAASNNP